MSQYKFLNFAIRQAASDRIVHRYKIKNGINYIQMVEGGEWNEIGHVLDLSNKGIPVPFRVRSD